MSHPIENIMKTSMEQIREMVDVNTVVGSPIIIGGETMVLPVSKVSLGFMSGGGEYQSPRTVKKSGETLDEETRYPFAGTTVAGMCMTPVAFLSVNEGEVRVMSAQYENTLERMVNFIPGALDAIGKLIGKVCRCDGEKSGE
ncbi:MAG: GerW family sporulation protein [Clostridia bacterium]